MSTVSVTITVKVYQSTLFHSVDCVCVVCQSLTVCLFVTVCDTHTVSVIFLLVHRLAVQWGWICLRALPFFYPDIRAVTLRLRGEPCYVLCVCALSKFQSLCKLA